MVLCTLMSTPLRAQSTLKAPDALPRPGATVRVATRVVSPFVMRAENSDKLRGFSIDLWEGIAREMDIKTQWVVEPTVKKLLGAVKEKRADVGIAAISITSERQKQFDFSQPMFDAGMQILVHGENGAPSIWNILTAKELLPLLTALPLLILIPAHIIWLIERNREDGLIENKKYFPGIGKAIWWAAGTIGAQADEMPRSPLGRLVAIVMMFIGVIFVAFFTAALTTALTVQQLRGEIQGPQDLPGKTVATTAGSTSATYLREAGVRVQEFAQIEDAFKSLDKKQVQAVVFDSPVLLYYAKNEGAGKAQVVGQVFRREDYGIVVRNNSPLRRRINEVLLTLREDGTYQELHDKWFGKES
jgi:polar amino acid transport system substrate-binding protein